MQRLGPLHALVMLAWAGTAQAFDTQACLAQPDQGCLFELALQQAEAEPHVSDLVGGFFRVAILQEQAGSTAYLETMARLEHAMPQAIWEEGRQGSDLGWPAIHANTLLQDGPAPETERLIDAFIAKHDRRYVSDRSPPPYPQAAQVREAAESGDVTLVHQLLAETPPYERERNGGAAALGFLDHGDVQAALNLANVIPDPDFFVELNRTVVVSLYLDQGLAEAEGFAHTIAAVETRRWAYASLAVDAARSGDFAASIRLLQYDDLQSVDAGAEWTLVLLAEAYARLGRADLTIQIADQMDPRLFGSSRGRRILDIAFAVAGDHQGFSDRLAIAPDASDTQRRVRSAVTAALAAGPHDRLRFLAALPDDHQTEAHIGYALALLEHDRFDEALSLYRSIEAYLRSADAPRARRLGLPQRIASGLAERGQMTEALEIAAALGPSTLTADIAALLD